MATKLIGKSLKERVTDKEYRFAIEYMVDMNGEQAAIRAGFSPKSARQQAAKMLKRPAVAEIVRRKKAAQVERLGLKADEVLYHLWCMATRTRDDFVDPETGQLRSDPSRWTERGSACLDGFDIEERTIETDQGEIQQKKTKVKLTPKTAAVDMALKHLGQYKLDNEQRPNVVVLDLESIRMRGRRPDPTDARIAALETDVRRIPAPTSPRDDDGVEVGSVLDEGEEVDGGGQDE